MIDFHPFDFHATVGRMDYGPYFYHAIWLPAAVVSDLPLDRHPRLRITGEIAGRPWDGAVNPGGNGEHFLILGKAFLKAAELAEGDAVRVAFRLGDQEAVDMPTDLSDALDDDPAARAIWDSLTPGTRRGFAHRVATAKRPETRAARVAEVLAALEGPAPSPYPRRR